MNHFNNNRQALLQQIGQDKPEHKMIREGYKS